jgi:hypothetical protein
MLSKTTLTLTAGSALLLSAAAFTPAFANYAHCTEQPSASDCQQALPAKTMAPQNVAYRERGAIHESAKQASLRQPSARQATVKQASLKRPSSKQTGAKMASAKKPESSTRHARSHEAPSSKSQPKSSS